MRKYEKLNPEKTPLILSQKPVKEKIAFLPEIIIDAGKNYRKEEEFLSPHSFFVIVSGGEERERNYFRVISNKDTFGRIKVEFIADPKQLNPDGLLETAKYKQAHYKTSQEDIPDKIFIVSDIDHFYNELVRIKPKCKKKDISLIISNSCFEIWLYYGKFSSKPTDFDIPANNLKISKSFKTYLGKKVKGGINPIYAIFDVSVAIHNAKTNYEEDENGIPKLFSTNMFLLAEELLPLIDSELKKLTLENEQKRRLYKKL
jgi:hypothetical protein